ncbi:MAG: hypothetical protein JNL22_00720 [Bacteroidales bacterium]|jgi:hypothetical protein|nr:hypothetical protein [Bacteroidales bacterium]
MKHLLLLALSSFLTVSLLAQDCEGYFPAKGGTFIETKNYDAKGKLTGTSQQTILSVDQIPGGLSLKVKSESLDSKDKLQYSQELGMRCENGVFYMDMKNFLDPNTMSGFKDMEVSVDGIDLEYPSVLQIGQTLKDGDIQMKFMSGGMSIMTMSVRMFNRKVEALESITTPAGTFECYKLTYDMEIKSMIKMTVKATQWVARNVGAVKTESFDKNGKLVGYSLLTAFRN